MILAQENGRVIGKPDKLFGVSSLAKERIAEKGREQVINSTIGVLLDDDGKLVVLDSVMKAIRGLAPDDFAAYAPIAGLPAYLEAVKKAVFMDEQPKESYVEACYAPGGTGAIRNAISAYTKPGDRILTSDWHWSPYEVVAAEIGRSVGCYSLFDEEMKFNGSAFGEKLDEILKEQNETLVIINTPAHNPTGYTLTDSDWDSVLTSIKAHPGKKIALLADIAYIDFAGDARKYRSFLKKLEGLPQNIMPLVAFSASKGYTMYGMRCGALLCMAPTAEAAKEFKDVMTVESRASWSNGNRAAMTVIAKIFEDEKLLKKVEEERNAWMKVLAGRGEAFVEAAEKVGLTIFPYDSGFFITVPCGTVKRAEAVGKALQEMDVFVIPLGSGIRVSAASNTMDECRRLPGLIAAAMEKCDKSGGDYTL